MRKSRFWAVIMEDSKVGGITIPGGFCYAWEKKHPEDPTKATPAMLWAIYPKKRDATNDCKFRGRSYVKEVFIKLELEEKLK